MAFWKKTDEKAGESAAQEAVDIGSADSVAEKAADERPAKPEYVPQSGGGRIIGVLRSSHMTEKTARGAEERTYVFRVSPRANKITVRAAVAARYGVDVDSVRILNTSEKARVRGRIIGWKPGFKKAMVTIKKGQKIEIQ